MAQTETAEGSGTSAGFLSSRKTKPGRLKDRGVKRMTKTMKMTAVKMDRKRAFKGKMKSVKAKKGMITQRFVRPVKK